MNEKKLQQLENHSIYTMKVSPDIKEQVVSGYLNDLSRVIKKEAKKKKLVVYVVQLN